MLYKENWEEAKKRFEAFWEKEIIDRCCLSFAVVKDKGKVVQRKDEDETYTKNKYTDVNTIYNSAVEIFENTTFLGESLPAIYPNFGTAGHVQYMGAKPVYAPDTIWFDPVVKNPDPSEIIFDNEDKVFKTHKKMVKGLADKSKGEFFIGMPDNCGIIDALAELRGTNNLLFDFVENPDFVKESTFKILNVLKYTGDKFFDIIKENNDSGSVHSWMHTWSPLRHAQTQCDFSVMISPEHFKEFVLPELEEVSSWLDHTNYHLDGQEQIRHLDMILSVKGIDNIQWTHVAGQPKIKEFIPYLQKIQKAGKGLILIPGADEVEFLLENLSHKGLHIIAYDVPTCEDANCLFKKACKLAR